MRRTCPMLIRVLALALMLGLAAWPAPGADAPPVSPAPAVPPKASDFLPKPADLGGEWRFPWEGKDSGFTEGEWRRKFHSDPRPQMSMAVGQLQALSDAEYQEFMQAMAQLAKPLGEAAGLPGAGAVAATQPAAPVTRQQAIDALRAVRDAVTDYAENDYTRDKPRAGAKPEANGFVMTDDDMLNVKLTTYSDSAVARKSADIDLAGLRQLVRTQTELLRRPVQNQAEYIRSLQDRINDLAVSDRDSENLKFLTEELENVVSRQVQVTGRFLSAGDSAYMVVTDDKTLRRRKVTITGRLRAGGQVFEITRTADTPFAPTAAAETAAMMEALAKRLAEAKKTPS